MCPHVHGCRAGADLETGSLEQQLRDSRPRRGRGQGRGGGRSLLPPSGHTPNCRTDSHREETLRALEGPATWLSPRCPGSRDQTVERRNSSTSVMGPMKEAELSLALPRLVSPRPPSLAGFAAGQGQGSQYAGHRKVRKF